MQETISTCDGCRETTNIPITATGWCIVNPVQAKRGRETYFIGSDRQMHFWEKCSEAFGLPKSVGKGVYGLLKSLGRISLAR